MSHIDRNQELIERYLDGLSTADEATELAVQLRDNSATADAFARATRFESLVESHFAEARAATNETPATLSIGAARTPQQRFAPRWGRFAAAAAAVVLITGFGWWTSRNNTASTATEHRVVAGRVLVNGIEGAAIVDDAQVEVVGSEAAVIRTSDGADVSLAPSSVVVFHRSPSGPIVELSYGKGTFRNRESARSIRVDTPVGAVSGGGDAEFAVQWQPTAEPANSSTADEGPAMNRNIVAAANPGMLALLTVAVLAGQVEVQDEKEKTPVKAGEQRAFAPEKKPMFAGKVTKISDDGRRVTLIGGPSKPGSAAPEREVQIDDDTDVSYFGVTKDALRPTVGHAAMVMLDPKNPERATTIEFGNKLATLQGKVTEVADDGRKLTVSVNRKGDAPLDRTILLDERTRTTYTGIETKDEKPTVGYTAMVWLAKDSDQAVDVRFAVKTKGIPAAETQKPQPTKKPEVTKKPETAKPDTTKPDELKKKSEPTNKPEPKQPETKKPDAKKPDSNAKPDSPKKPEMKKPEPTTKPDSVKPAKSDVSQKKELPPQKAVPSRVSTRDPLPVAAAIDAEIDRRLVEAKLTAAPQADDAEFLRRASLDITGKIPSYSMTVAFLGDDDPEKRQKLVDQLLADPAYGYRFGAVWKKLMSPKPANSGKPAPDKITPWLAEQFNQNRGWNEIVRELLTTEANPHRDPQAFFFTVNSESAVPKPNLLAAATAKLFLGVQLGCAECHNHPFAEWKQSEFWNLAAFFGRTRNQSKMDASLTEATDEPATTAEIKIPEGGKDAGKMIPARFLGDNATIDPSVPLRPTLATWLTARENPYFARTMTNRLWAHFFGHGLVEPLDGFQEGFEPSHPEVLAALTAEFVASDFDLKHVVRIICNTKAYGRTSGGAAETAEDKQLLARMAVKTLSADVLYDSLMGAVNARLIEPVSQKGMKVALPDPFVIAPRDEFVNFYSSAAVDAGANEYAYGIPQVLRLMNAEAFNTGAPLVHAVATSEGSIDDKVERLYLAVLSRRPTAAERETLSKYLAERKESEQAYAGALWILLNTSEFVLNR